MTGKLEIREHIVTEPAGVWKPVLAGDVQGSMWHNAASKNGSNNGGNGQLQPFEPFCLGKSELTIGVT